MPKDPFDGEDKVTEEYPGFVVHDGRVTGSITLGHSRLPLWCLINIMIDAGYSAAAEDYPILSTCATAAEIGSFLYNLLEHRREFARLLCVLADVERQEREPANASMAIPIDPGNLPSALQPWYKDPKNRERVRAVLHRCLNELDHFEAEDGS